MSTEETTRNERLLEVALRVTDGLPIDWELERTGKPDEDHGLESLALIASIAANHHTVAASTSAPLFAWGELRVLRKLGDGRLGEQYVAWDPALGREVILEIGPSNAGASGRTARHFDALRRLARIEHPSLRVVHGVSVRDARLGIWFEQFHGRTLEEDLLDRGPMGAREAALVGIDLCSALGALHAAGVVHGAIDTRNAIRVGVPGSMRNAGRVVLGGVPPPVPVARIRGATATGPRTDAAPSRADDLEAVGVLLHRLVTGCDPSKDDSKIGDFASGEASTGLRSIRPDLPMTLVQVIEKALAGVDPERGFRDATAIETALMPLLGVEAGTAVGRRARFHWRWRMIVAGAAAAAAAAALAIGASRNPHVPRAWLHRPPNVPAIACHLRLPVIGTQAEAWFGYYSGVSPGDVNGDGAPDLLWGSSFANDGRGRAYILFGGRDADSIPDLVLTGSAPQENYGNSVAGLGDVNGDGFADFAVAATGDDAVFPDAGRVEVYFGGSKLDTRPDLILRGQHVEQVFGFWVTGVGDLNADGFADLVVGAPFDEVGGKWSGRVFVFFGGDSMDSVADLELSSNTTADQFGTTVAGAGDLNGDGYPDLAVGSFLGSVDGSPGRAYVYWGGPGVDSRPDLVLPGHDAGEGLFKVAAAGDVNGDGFDDLAVGAEFGDGLQPGSGLVYVYFGGPTADDAADVILLGEGSGDLFGCWVAGPGDLNQDGFTDLVVGARRNDANGENAGAVYVFFGGRTMDAQTDLRFVGETPNAEMGSACGSAGDFFGDGFPDLFISSHGFSSDVLHAGRMDIFDVSRYALLNPLSERLQSKDSPLVLRWSGAERADVSVSVDHRQSWSRVAPRAGGHEVNEITIGIQAATYDTLFVRLTPTKSDLSGSLDAAFPIRP